MIGRNLVKLKKLMTSSLILNYNVIIVMLKSWQLKKGKFLIDYLFLDGLR